MNHAFVHVRANLDAKEVEAFLKDLVLRKWAGAVEVIPSSKDHWLISAPGHGEFPFSLSIWIRSARKIEMRKCYGDPSSWLQAFIRDHLAAHFKGRCGDEGVSQKFKPEPDRFWDYAGWFLSIYDGSGLAFANKLWRQELEVMPPALLGVLKARPLPAGARKRQGSG
jgi:hypothetical protein